MDARSDPIQRSFAMNEMIIRKMTHKDQGKLIRIEDRFVVDSILLLSLEENNIQYSVKKIPSYEKSYIDDPFEKTVEADYSTYIDNPDQVVYLAFVGNQIVGQVVVKRNWNEYAYIEDIKVDKKFRRYGIGRELMEQAKSWAQNHGMPGIMLETQNNNVKACNFMRAVALQ